MKTKKRGILLVLAACAVVFIAIIIAVNAPSKETNREFLRLHIRADSNLTADQNVKYKVKEAVIRHLTPLVSECRDRSEAMRALKNGLPGIRAAADSVLSRNGFSYRSEALLKEEVFPDRSYDGVVLPAGVYDALIINLGSGKGDNGWCVVYPPLCFQDAGGSDGNGITYKSKIAEIIKDFFG
jgi:stage II sporulation protein R